VQYKINNINSASIFNSKFSLGILNRNSVILLFILPVITSSWVVDWSIWGRFHQKFCAKQKCRRNRRQIDWYNLLLKFVRYNRGNVPFKRLKPSIWLHFDRYNGAFVNRVRYNWIWLYIFPLQLTVGIFKKS
jgi:hypothetical protein